MDDRDIIEMILNDDSIEYSREQLQEMLDDELKKLYSDRDYDLIEELVECIIMVDEEEAEMDVDTNIEKLINTPKKKLNTPKFIKIPVAASIIFVILFSANMVTISAFNINIFSEIVEFGEDIIKFDFNRQQDLETISLETSTEDPYGIKAETEKLGIESMVPTYIPEGYELKKMETDGLDDNSYDYLSLHYKEKKNIINIDITKYHNRVSDNIGIPSENGSLEVKKINGMDIFILSKDDWYISIFSKDLVVYEVSTNSDYETIISILESFR